MFTKPKFWETCFHLLQPHNYIRFCEQRTVRQKWEMEQGLYLPKRIPAVSKDTVNLTIKRIKGSFYCLSLSLFLSFSLSLSL